MPLSPTQVLAAAGGVAPYRRVVRLTGRHALRRAVASGAVVRLGRNRYGLPGLDEQLAAAHGARGCLSHLSAAVHHGWGVLHQPDRLHLTLPRGHKHGDLPGTRWFATTLDEAELAAGVTSPLRTVLDCARTLPLPAALAVADSALRAGHVRREELCALADVTRTTGAVAARRVVRLADGRAANPFESALRAVVLGTGLRGFIPQLVVTGPGLLAVVDLGDPDRRVALEADGYGVHGTRRAFARDLARHDELQAAGWLTRRFAFEHVLRRPAWVAEQVLGAVAQRVVPAPRRHRRRVGGVRDAA
ncbi:hypothetical protein [Aquipuribacter sp. SD81]|uniref:hypothetical protein n=1 Tax=Aquipuribacter sp. SD81 TaxID=3127703 RepID=UPI0030183003